jgi:hypothetical protein
MTSTAFGIPIKPLQKKDSTMHVDIKADAMEFSVEVTEEAKDDIRLKVNPSNVDNVSQLKTLAAAYLSLMTKIKEEMKEKGTDAGREFAIARTDFQKVSMMAVLAATKGL